MKFNFSKIKFGSVVNNRDFDWLLLVNKPKLRKKKFGIVDSYFDYHQPKPFKHAYVDNEKSNHACTYEWDTFDSEEKFKNNLTNNKELQYYVEYPIQYTINSLAHRNSKELDEFDNTIDVCLGDSYTFGVGLHREHTWASLLEKHNDIQTYNAGLPGCGVLTWYRSLRYLSTVKTIRNVFLFAPLGFPRYEFYNPSSENYQELNVHLQYFSEKKEYWPLMVEENISLMYSIGLDAIQGFCNRENINFYFLTFQETMMYQEEYNIKDQDIPARDLRHFSMNENKLVYNLFKQKVGKLL